MSLVLLNLLVVSALAAPAPPIGGLAGWDILDNPAGDKESIRSSLVPLMPFDNIPVGTSTVGDVMCMIQDSTPLTKMRNYGGSPTPGMDFIHHGFSSVGDLDLSPEDAALNWTFRDGSSAATYASANFLVTSTPSGAVTWQTATGNKLGNGENNIVMVTDAVYDEIQAEFSLPQFSEWSNASTLVWYEQGQVFQGPGGTTIATSDCLSPTEADIFIREKPRVRADNLQGWTHGVWVRGHSTGFLFLPDDTGIVSLTETLMHEMGHAFTLQHPRKPVTNVGDGSVASILADFHPHGGGLMDVAEPRESYSSDGGRVLTADVEWVREFFALPNSISTSFLTNEKSSLLGGDECRIPGDLTEPNLLDCAPFAPGDPWADNVVIVPAVVSVIPPEVEYSFYQKVTAKSKHVWIATNASAGLNVEDVDLSSGGPALVGFNACRGKRFKKYDGTSPPAIRLVNLGPQDVDLEVSVDLIAINPANRADNSTAYLQKQATWQFNASTAYIVGTVPTLRLRTRRQWDGISLDTPSQPRLLMMRLSSRLGTQGLNSIMS